MRSLRSHATRRAPVFALFRVAAGPRLGHGHLRRAEALADALGQPSCVSVRGGATHTRLRRTPHRSPAQALAAETPAVVVLDDPHQDYGAAWCRAAARRAIPVVSLHDLGLARVPSTLAVDGSVTSPARGWPSDAVLRGLEYAVIRPPRRRAGGRTVRRVLVSLGGGPRRRLVEAIAVALAARWPDLEIVVPHAIGPRAAATRRVEQVSAPDGLAPLLATVDAAIVGGGVSLYEAVAAGVPTVALAVVPAQEPTVRAFAARRLAVDGGRADGAVARIAETITHRFETVVRDDVWRRRIRVEGPRAVDGRGAQRVARAIATLVDHSRRERTLPRPAGRSLGEGGSVPTQVIARA